MTASNITRDELWEHVFASITDAAYPPNSLKLTIELYIPEIDSVLQSKIYVDKAALALKQFDLISETLDRMVETLDDELTSSREVKRLPSP